MQLFRVLCLLLACGVVSALCSALVIESRLKNETQLLPEEKTVGTLVEKPQSAGVTENAAALPSVGSSMTATEIYELACRQSVGIQVTSTGFNIWGQAVIGSPISGSGFIVSENGYVVTNYHVIENAAKNGRSDITVQFYDESSYPATLVGYDSEADLAVLKIDAEGLSAVTVGSMDACRVGSRVYAIGNPLGELTFTMTDGMICALDRVITTGTSASINVFQINAAVNSGNSGGPVYNERGEVIGIVDAKYAAAGVEGIGFAIPLDDAVDMINDLVTTGHVTGRSYLGVSVRTITASVAAYYNLPQGAYVDYVEGGSCAEKCGLISGDIITQIGSYDIKSSEDVRLAKSSYRAGDTVTLEWYRNGETHTAELVFDEEQ
ncbi:MAG: S1C family serine protease [Oscillospiraceae bacterium]|nr:S1C family serine protease [Oscillospiraceae bacterium]